MIHVCFAVYDPLGTYSKYAAAAICSIFENTREKVQIHLLHDETVKKETYELFVHLCKKYGQEISFYKLNVAEFDSVASLTCHFTVGTLFRLKIASLLPSSVHRIIYLDADIIVNLDICFLWSIDLGLNTVAACIDPMVSNGNVDPWPCLAGMTKREHYFNAGVMLLNLDCLRERGDFFKEAISFLREFPKCHLTDQDVMNSFFQKSVIFLPRRYNLFTKLLRDCEDIPTEGIYHFADDFMHFENPKIFDRKFFHYLLKTPWGNSDFCEYFIWNCIQEKCQRSAVRQMLMNRILELGVKCILFGASGLILEMCMKYLPWLMNRVDYCIDNNVLLQSSHTEDVMVYAPEKLMDEEKENIVIMIASLHYSGIKKQLESYGLEEDKNFFDIRILLLPEQGGFLLKL